MIPEVSPAETERRDALAGRLFEAAIASFDVLTIHLGLELGLYEALRGTPATARELASRAGIDARYAREWLEQQAVTGILEVDDVSADEDARRYSLPEGHAEALLEPESPAASQSMLRFVVSGARMLPAIAAAYRTGAGVASEQYPDHVLAQELANRPTFRHVLAQEWLSAIPDLHERLTAGGRVADVACGAGWSSVAIARAYPAATIEGFDVDPDSIEKARANAAAAGLGEDRVRFNLVDAAQARGEGQFDAALIVEAVHDMADPVAVLASVRRLLAPGGVLIVADEGVQEAFTAPGDEIERTMYSYSVLFCLPQSRVDTPSVATGAAIRPDTMRRYGLDAGFSGVSVLPIAKDVFRLYRLDP